MLKISKAKVTHAIFQSQEQTTEVTYYSLHYPNATGLMNISPKMVVTIPLSLYQTTLHMREI